MRRAEFLMSGLIKDRWILLCAFAFMLLCYTMLTEVYEDVASHRYIVRKGQGILIALQITLDTP